MRTFLLAIFLCGCGASARDTAQTVITDVAEIALVETTHSRGTYHRSRDQYCREHNPPGGGYTYADWFACMRPSIVLDQAVTALDATLRVAQAALDASKEEEFRSMVPCLVDAAMNAYVIFDVLGLDVPQEVLRLTQLAQSVTGSCEGGAPQ